MFIPTIECDPDDDTEVWRHPNGRLCVRRKDGSIAEFVPAEVPET